MWQISNCFAPPSGIKEPKPSHIFFKVRINTSWLHDGEWNAGHKLTTPHVHHTHTESPSFSLYFWPQVNSALPRQPRLLRQQSQSQQTSVRCSNAVFTNSIHPSLFQWDSGVVDFDVVLVFSLFCQGLLLSEAVSISR